MGVFPHFHNEYQWQIKVKVRNPPLYAKKCFMSILVIGTRQYPAGGRLSTEVVNCRDRLGPGLNLDLRDLYHLLCHHSRWHLRFNSPIAKNSEKMMEESKNMQKQHLPSSLRNYLKTAKAASTTRLSRLVVWNPNLTRKKNIKTRICSHSQKKNTP